MEYVTGRRGTRRKQLLYGLKETRRDGKLKQEASYRTLCRIRFGTACGPVLRQSTE